ncbi:hypothetical protein BOTBODRAFT_255133 [Botryobasidium botryosum FD-172 SS1]|uniref:Uncharacterized protein n=1 Tax=Botryobasidium botryosum (strain FD-172 SS1) TaxID=930990 RepID=A0A067M3B0_BOTB1|nr:hypothetical protein BOTBODRAFT_255133 [Botryobasidium botryosum FD-172 SS1]
MMGTELSDLIASSAGMDSQTQGEIITSSPCLLPQLPLATAKYKYLLMAQNYRRPGRLHIHGLHLQYTSILESQKVIILLLLFT